eukprot:s1028_g12.t3
MRCFCPEGCHCLLLLISPDVEARSALSKWPGAKAELLVNEISHLHQERSELRREKQQLQKRGLSEAQLVEAQLEAAKHGTQQTRERRDALKKLATSGPAVASKSAILQAEQNITNKVGTLRRETQELAERRQELFEALQQSQSSQAQLQQLVTSELRQQAAQQAQSCSLQVELKLMRDKLRMSEREREDLHLKHVQLTAQFQATLAVARKEVSDRSARLKQQLLQEDDVADCLGEAADRFQAQIDAAMASQKRQRATLASMPEEAPKGSAHLNVAPSPGEDELKSNLSSALRQIGDLKQHVHELQAEKAGLRRLKRQQCINQLRKISKGLVEWHQALRAAMSQAPRSLAPYKEDMDKVKRLLAGPVATSSMSATTSSVAQRVLEAFNEEVPCHSLDLASLLMGPDDAYVISAVMQLIQSEVKRQAYAIHSSLTASRLGAPGAMEEVVGRLQQMQKQLLLEVVSSNEDEDDEIWDLELHLALLVGRRDEVLQMAQVKAQSISEDQDGKQRDGPQTQEDGRGQHLDALKTLDNRAELQGRRHCLKTLHLPLPATRLGGAEVMELFIGRIPPSVSVNKISEIFAPYGASNVRIFANFENHFDAQRAISELNGYQMGAGPGLNVKPAANKSIPMQSPQVAPMERLGSHGIPGESMVESLAQGPRCQAVMTVPTDWWNVM